MPSDMGAAAKKRKSSQVSQEVGGVYLSYSWEWVDAFSDFLENRIVSAGSRPLARRIGRLFFPGKNGSLLDHICMKHVDPQTDPPR
jgi:hypothetical protein